MLEMYLDESGTHNGSPVVTVAGYAGQAETWSQWSVEWNATKLPYGIGVYHAVDCHNRVGEFDGWSEAHRNNFVKAMLPIIPKHPIAGIAVGIDLRCLEASFMENPELAVLFGTPYVACFQWAIQTFLDRIAAHPRGEQRVAFFHECNDYQADALKAFTYVQEQRGAWRPAITLTFAAKKSYVPLQCADILAYLSNQALRRPNEPPSKPWRTLNPNGDAIELLHYGKQNMPEMIRLLTGARNDALAAGWDGRSTT